VPPESSRLGLYVTLAVALGYCTYLGAHWLPLGYSDKELAASASRVWDVKCELTEHHHLPWWTPHFMSGSSYGLNHSRGFYLLPWMLLSTFTDLGRAGKLMALVSIFASAVAMYFCARFFFRTRAGTPASSRQSPIANQLTEWGAALSAFVFLIHPEQIIRAASAEHMTISLFFPFIPLLWWTFAHMLESGKFRDVFLCALVAVFAMWTDNKQAVIQFLFLFAYLIYWLWPAQHRARLKSIARNLGLLAALGIGIGLCIVVPGLVESKYDKLFYGDPLADWQKSYAFKSLFGLVDRNGAATKAVAEAALTQVNARGGVRSQAEMDSIRRVFAMQMDAPEKYAGIALLLIIAVTALWNRGRVNRMLFWFFVAMFLLSLMLAMGPANVWSANLKTFDALSQWRAIPLTIWLALIGAAAFLVIFARRKLTSPRKWVIACVGLVMFLFVPSFGILSVFPYFKDIRAPYAFYDGPAVFWSAILAGFVVTDLIKSRLLWIVAGLAALLLLDFWPYQKSMKENPVPARTLQNLEAAYGSLRTDPDWVKTYSVSGRYFHLLGPMYSGKPQVYEAFYNWMAPLGTGLINQHAFENLPAFLNLMGARYPVFDKTDPSNEQMKPLLDFYRKTFLVTTESDDFAIFRNDSAHEYVTGYERACLFVGDVRQSPQLALALNARDWPLVHSDTERAGNFAQVYRVGGPTFPPLQNGKRVPLDNVSLVRENNDRVRISLTAPGNCLAVICESYYPFWHAKVDGRPAEVLRVTCALMGVELSAGAHEILLRYEPPHSYAVAGGISAMTLLVGVVATIRSCRPIRSRV
jgi:hypothetical protein